jgi:hypothetical protein
MNRVRNATATLSLLLLTFSACGRHHAPGEVLRRLEWVLQVENHHSREITVSVIHDGQRTPVGTVSAVQTVTFTLAPNLLGQDGEIRLYADPLGGVDTFTTATIRVQSGQRVLWTSESQLRNSSLAVY